MSKLKIIFLLMFILVLTFYIKYQSISLAALWAKTHINSLIGFQKSIEIISYNLWYQIFIPIINLPTFIFLILIQILIILIFKKLY